VADSEFKACLWEAIAGLKAMGSESLSLVFNRHVVFLSKKEKNIAQVVLNVLKESSSHYRIFSVDNSFMYCWFYG
jgi:hypothetical protein